MGQPPVAHQEEYLVQCRTTHGPLGMKLIRPWSPRGVDRVLELVATNFFTHSAIYRAVCGFMVQFGISGKAHYNRYWDDRSPVLDDPPLKKSISRRSIVLIGGSEPNTRMTEVGVLVKRYR